MTHNRHIDIDYTEYASPGQLPERERELVEAAVEAMDASYSPYSHFRVGAAVRLTNGVIVRGANQENAAFPSGTCAERSAMFAASSQYPDQGFEAIAVAGGLEGVLSDHAAAPCGACRQVMAQYQRKSGRPMEVFLVAKGSILKFDKVDDILPLIFESI